MYPVVSSKIINYTIGRERYYLHMLCYLDTCRCTTVVLLLAETPEQITDRLTLCCPEVGTRILFFFPSLSDRYLSVGRKWWVISRSCSSQIQAV